MVLTDFKNFPHVGKILGIDWGARRIGLAISDAGREFFFVRPIMENKPRPANAAADVAAVARAEGVAGIVVGLPLRGDGCESDTTRAVRRFADELASIIDLPIVFINENLTSVEAQERQKAKGKRQKYIDSESARVILENAAAMIRRSAK
ncbi:MAG: Holliday junction resolvase RuvX [Rickettsiales bacterium]|jgi:putative Holliday junction resolvase|nr:Holliday junction resolvase RuvX [Rickettsiales bacterium]